LGLSVKVAAIATILPEKVFVLEKRCGSVIVVPVMKSLVSLLAALLLLVPSVRLQAQGTPGVANISFLRLFAQQNFTAKTQLDMYDEMGKILMTVDGMDMTFLNGDFRADVDMAKIKGPGLSEEEMVALKQSGMDRASTIMRQDLKRLYLIYPGLKAYADIVLPAETVITTHGPKITKSPIGQETINAHPCVKNKVTFTDPQGKQEEMTVWEAADLKNLPVQVKMIEKGRAVVIQFKEIQMTKPAKSQFEPPEGFARYTDIKTMMMQRMSGAGRTK
jgi:hypothetical protein